VKPICPRLNRRNIERSRCDGAERPGRVRPSGSLNEPRKRCLLESNIRCANLVVLGPMDSPMMVHSALFALSKARNRSDIVSLCSLFIIIYI
jgi:hypothetical protein